eukprot:TRINITY_DN6884_c0_g1_i1.p5 TRINITY_DN6884_c0_g1~~TRINITY_DN6884_c0_g1_i1.p5  ORF type:complete len:197 (-),score=5.66 TRINITY_DN6884_c0_g1_i1:2048-2638(-)
MLPNFFNLTNSYILCILVSGILYLTEGLVWLPVLIQSSNEGIYMKGTNLLFPQIKYRTTKIQVPYLTMVPRMEDPGTVLLENCEDIVDGNCGRIDQFSQCGFCLEDSYPLKGYGVIIDSNFNETSCAGVVLDHGNQCPMPIDCNAVLTCMLNCGKQEKLPGQIVEVPDSCQDMCNSDHYVLSACQLTSPSDTTTLL